MCNVVWAKDVVGRPTTGVTSVTLCGPRIWWKANYMCNKCNVEWTQDVEGRPTTGVTSVTLSGPRMLWEGQLQV